MADDPSHLEPQKSYSHKPPWHVEQFVGCHEGNPYLICLFVGVVCFYAGAIVSCFFQTRKNFLIKTFRNYVRRFRAALKHFLGASKRSQLTGSNIAVDVPVDLAVDVDDDNEGADGSLESAASSASGADQVERQRPPVGHRTLASGNAERRKGASGNGTLASGKAETRKGASGKAQRIEGNSGKVVVSLRRAVSHDEAEERRSKTTKRQDPRKIKMNIK